MFASFHPGCLAAHTSDLLAASARALTPVVLSAVALSAVALSAVALSGSLQAQTPLIANRIPGFYDRPSFLTAPDGDDRLFISESSNGRILIFENGAPLPTPFLDLSGTISTGFTQGLLGFTFHPRYDQNGFLFTYSTRLDGDVLVERFQVSDTDPNLVDPTSRTTVLVVPEPFTDNSGGGLVFGPDGFLYIGIGDGGGVLDPFCSAQDRTTMLGKILRIDVDTIDTTGTYAIPSTNPFVGDPTSLPEIWHLGFAQPWRFTFDRRNGSMWIADVGENTSEEINRVEPLGRGLNFGWQVLEGDLCTADFASTSCVPPIPPCDDPSFRLPSFSYPHDFTTFGCAVMGGFVYDGCAIPDLQGQYFFGDFCTGRVWSVDADSPAPLVPTERTLELFAGSPPSNLTSFGRDGHGELYVLDLSGLVYRIEPAVAPPIDCPDLLAFTGALSISDGGTQELFLDAGSAHADRLYLVLGSATGTAPGIPIGTLELPLVMDNYTQLTLSAPNQGLLEDTLGLLDSNGQALARFDLPGGQLDLGLAGLELNHAFLVLDVSQGLAVPATSQPSSLLLQ